MYIQLPDSWVACFAAAVVAVNDGHERSAAARNGFINTTRRSLRELANEWVEVGNYEKAHILTSDEADNVHSCIFRCMNWGIIALSVFYGKDIDVAGHIQLLVTRAEERQVVPQHTLYKIIRRWAGIRAKDHHQQQEICYVLSSAS